MDTVDHPYFVDFPKNAPKEPGIDIDVSVITKNLPRSKVVTEDEAGAKELAQYDLALEQTERLLLMLVIKDK